uniref:Uncharacterized protein n=1 Tax=Haemonchus contortus TaxID=6289 RepID=W6NE77_HAECO
MEYFPQTKIQQYSNKLGDFSNLRHADVDDYFAFVFTIDHCVCKYVEQWVNQIVQDSQNYTSGTTRCYGKWSPISRERTATKTKTLPTTASSAMTRQPAPPPHHTEKGSSTAHVTLVTNQPYDLSKVKQHMEYFPQTKIQQYSNQFGDFANLKHADVNDYFAFVFTINHCVCGYVEQWVNQIVQNSQNYTSGNTRCTPDGSSIYRERTATTTTITTTTPTTASSFIAPQPAPPPYRTGKGDDTAHVTLVTNQPYDPSKVKQQVDYFPQTKIEQYANQLGDLSNLRYGDANGNFALTFTISRSDCENVKKWVNQIVQSSQYYTSGGATCFYDGSSVIEKEAATTITPTTAPSSFIVIPVPVYPPPLDVRVHVPYIPPIYEEEPPATD